MNLGHALFSLDGRIGRKTYWISSAILAIVAVPLVFLAVTIFIDDAGGLDALNRSLAWLSLATFAIFGYFMVSISGKRLHDRNKSAWLLVLYMVPVILDPIYTLAGIGGTPQNPDALRVGTTLIAAIIAIWFFIELGFLKGTAGSNQYGDDPLA